LKLIYIAGPLFSLAERRFLESICDQIEASGRKCFLPHRDATQTAGADYIFAADYAALAKAPAMVLWLDGSSVDDGTACELGIYFELWRADPAGRAVLALATDLRLERRHAAGLPMGGTNLFVSGLLAKMEATVCWSTGELIGAVRNLGSLSASLVTPKQYAQAGW
jgi:Nucleoside 2-deoxyribosyltransferase